MYTSKDWNITTTVYEYFQALPFGLFEFEDL